MEIFSFNFFAALGLLFVSIGLLFYVRKQIFRIRKEKKELLVFNQRKNCVLGELVDTFNGTKLIIDPNDNSVSNFIKVQGNWEEHVRKMISKTAKEGDVVVVLGGHIGYHVLEFSKLVGPKGRVYVFEASPHNFFYLNLNLKINGASNVVCFQKAVYSKPGKLNFSEQSSYGQNSGNSHVISGEGDNIRSNIIQVEAVVLDDFLTSLDKIDILQMDIEGSEVAAIAGAKNLLMRYLPSNVISEYSWFMMANHGNVHEFCKILVRLRLLFCKNSFKQN